MSNGRIRLFFCVRFAVWRERYSLTSVPRYVTASWEHLRPSEDAIHYVRFIQRLWRYFSTRLSIILSSKRTTEKNELWIDRVPRIYLLRKITGRYMGMSYTAPFCRVIQVIHMIFLVLMDSTGRILYPPEYRRRTFVVNTPGKKALSSLISVIMC